MDKPTPVQLEWLRRWRKSRRQVPPEAVAALIAAGLLERAVDGRLVLSDIAADFARDP
jgi:hypothetical protein